MTQPIVRRERAAERDAIAAVLTDAFVDEAGLNYWLRQDTRKERARQAFFGAVVRDALNPKREIWVAESGGAPMGAAVWLAPGLKAFEFPWWRELLYTPLSLYSGRRWYAARPRTRPPPGRASSLGPTCAPSVLGCFKRDAGTRRGLCVVEGNSRTARSVANCCLSGGFHRAERCALSATVLK